MMPAIPRISKKAQKIAFAILGVPVNLQVKRTKQQKRVNQRLLFEETVRVR